MQALYRVCGPSRPTRPPLHPMSSRVGDTRRREDRAREYAAIAHTSAKYRGRYGVGGRDR